MMSSGQLEAVSAESAAYVFERPETVHLSHKEACESEEVQAVDYAQEHSRKWDWPKRSFLQRVGVRKILRAFLIQ